MVVTLLLAVLMSVTAMENANGVNATVNQVSPVKLVKLRVNVIAVDMVCAVMVNACVNKDILVRSVKLKVCLLHFARMTVAKMEFVKLSEETPDVTALAHMLEMTVV
jgi:hypothetical protein